MAQTLLPNEAKVRRAIPTLLADELATCRELVTFGVALPNTKEDLHAGSLRHDTVVTAIALYVKATTSFRAVIELCEAGLERNAMPVSRSLFETAVNLTFLIRQRVSLNQFNDSKTKPKTPLDLFGKQLTTDFRTDLYNGWCILRDEKNIAGWTRTPGIKRAGKLVSKTVESLEQPYVDSIGPEWEKRIRGSNTCVGLKIVDFASSLGTAFRLWYHIVYAADSKHVHQSDMMSYLDLSDPSGVFAPRWYTSPDEVRTALHKAAIMYLCCVEELNKRFRFGSESKDQIRLFGKTLRQWSPD